MVHKLFGGLRRGAVERVDDVSLDIGEDLAVHKMLRDGGADGRCWRIEVFLGDGERSTEENGCAAVVDHDDPPEVDAQLALFWGECRTLSSGVVVQAQFDGQTDHTADQAPKGSLVPLGSRQ